MDISTLLPYLPEAGITLAGILLLVAAFYWRAILFGGIRRFGNMLRTKWRNFRLRTRRIYRRISSATGSAIRNSLFATRVLVFTILWIIVAIALTIIAPLPMTIAVGLWIIVAIALTIIAPLPMTIAVGLWIGFFAFLFILPYVPGAIEALSNQPNRYRRLVNKPAQDITARDYPKSMFGFFTKPYPGQVKIIERGARFMSCIMAFDRHMFKGELPTNTYTPRHAEYWEVIKTPRGRNDSHPIPFPPLKKPWWWILYSPLSLVWWMWKRHVYRITGYVFSGIPPFQGPRVYPMERFKRVTRSSGKVELERVEDYSDHYRVAHFQYPMKLSDVDTQDKQPVSVLLNEVARVHNPYEVAYNTDDDWPTRFTGSISNRVTWFARPKPLDQVWVAADSAEAEALANAITQVGTRPIPADVPTQGSTCAFGITIENTQVLDVSPMDPAVEKKLGDVAIAKVDRDARKIRADGDAEYFRKTAAALHEYPEGAVVVQADAMVKAAQAAAANGNVVLLGTGTSPDPMQAANLQQLRRLGRKGGTP